MQALMARFSRVINIALRGSTLIAKFGLLALMAVLMAPSEVGQYGLLTAAIGWTMYFVGWEFYTFSMREIISQGAGNARALARNQAVLYGATYLAIAPVVVLIFATGLLPSRYGVWFAVLLVLEHLGLEVGRALLSLSRPLIASLMLFLRGGLWCIVVAGTMLAVPEFRHIDLVLVSWAIGSGLGLVVGLACFYRITERVAARHIDWRWIGKGLTVALPLMAASLSIRGIFTIDRIWVEQLSGGDVLGAYVLFIGVATAILSFVDAGIIDFAYPRVVKSAKTGNNTEFRNEMRQLEWRVGLAVLVLSLACWLGFALFVRFLPNPVYQQNLGLLAPIVLAMALYGVSAVPHVALYAHDRDRIIVASQIVALGVFFVVVFALGPSFGVAAVPTALLASFITVLLWKTMAYLALQRRLAAIPEGRI